MTTELSDAPAVPDVVAGLTATPIAAGLAPDGLRAALAGRVEAQLFHVALEPGVRTPWHYHLGDVLGIITTGTLTRVMADGSIEICPEGSAVVERGGEQHVHYGRNDGPGRLEFYAVYLAPEGAPLSIDAATPDPEPS